MYSLGIDSGSTTTKGILFDGENIVKKIIIPTSASPHKTILKLYEELHDAEVGYTVTTGYGRNLLEYTDKQITEITCHAKGAAYLYPEATAVIDIGGQDSKAILLDEDKNVIEFLMNDKCAAGTGRFVDVIMRLLEEDIANIDDFVKDKSPAKISSMCTVFAESEVISLLAKGEERGNIALGIIESICKRTAIFAQKLNIEGDVFFSGGLSNFDVFNRILEKHLEKPVKSHPLGQFNGAIGAAILAYKNI